MVEVQQRRSVDAPHLADDERVPAALLGLLVAAALNVAIFSLTDHGTAGGITSGGWPVLTLFLLWRVWRGGHVSWVLSGTLATVGALVFVLSAASQSPATYAVVLALLHLALTAVLLSRPVRRLVGRAA